jgi:DNA-binding Lrp family transcriptional regulator
MPEEKYVPNSAVMGGSAARKINFFGRDKIGAEKAIGKSSSPAPDSPPPDSSVPDSSSSSVTSTPTAPENALETEGHPAPDSPGDGLPHYGRPRAVDGVHPERHSASDSPVSGSPVPDRPTVNLWSSLPQVEGHLRLPNIIVDHLFQLLDLQERSVYEQLYRLSHGYGKLTCRIGYPQLAIRSGMGRTAVIQTVERLVKKGLIARIGTAIGGRKEQGSEYWVSAPGSPVPDSPSAGSSGAEPNKIKALKENIKKGGASHQKRDYSDCPDCHGVGMWYPEGYDKGVAKCLHLKRSK